ncbi:conserved hypothetical protein [Magnetococcus marinus MC-1]|uniref:DUF6900 domain-containing protein n=1 Tax=Magnetococcus marinus (strain ATCC BAA-1437 / JCM 17883 / MC-1) TaxID=156889 RepID=A0L788_MAGMM|nr:DUF3489 domain-containing protein [Magnetococcus marinus]ABK43831.1 conserved hypothetical protein [Magnetococcus marinus MC-1]
MINLTHTQQTILKAAAQRPDGSINPLPERIKGGASVKVINALEAKGLIENVSINPPYPNWVLTSAAYQVIGQEPPALPPVENQIIDTMTEETAGEKPEETETPDDPEAGIFTRIALDHLFIDTLETRNSDSLDFHNVSVWGVQSALEAAFQAGIEAAQRKTPRSRGTRANSKQATMIEMMKRPQGATLDQITEETGWGSNTIRGAISGTLKKKLGLNVTRAKVDGITTYRITE